MMSSDIGDAFVESKKGQLVGMVTDRDLAIRAVAKGMDPTIAKVKEVMTAEVTTLAPTDSLQEAIELMRARNVRRLPVVESGKAIGIISLASILPAVVTTRPRQHKDAFPQVRVGLRSGRTRSTVSLLGSPS